MVIASKDHFLQTADRIANSLCRDALWDGARCTWLGWVDAYENSKLVPRYASSGSDLYSGSSGIAMFLAAHYQYSQDRQHLRAIEGAVNQALSLQDQLISQKRYGVYFGVSGLALAYLRIGRCLHREELVKRAMSLLRLTKDMPHDLSMLDLITGSAGLILVLLSFAREFGSSEFVEMAIAHGEYLLQQACRSERGISWQTFVNAKHQNLTGYAHGVSGIALALLELHAETGDDRFHNTAREALRYESSWFSEKQRNWFDLRMLNDLPDKHHEPDCKCGLAWCYGAPGIGMSRLRISALLPQDVEIKSDLEIALSTTVASMSAPWQPGNGNYSLCHGASGNAELLLMAGQQLGRPELTRLAEKVGEDGIEYYVKQGLPWPCGNRGGGETPNLMLGTAGIGYFYLRLYDPVNVPSVLLISP